VKVYLTRRYRFPASHRLNLEDCSEAENQRVYGKCSNPHGHGHDYGVEVTVSGKVNPRTGMICDLPALDSFVHKHVVERYDHANLNTLAEFQKRVPTTENLCREIYERLQGFSGAQLEKVRIEETRKNSFEIGNVLP
jgi:6-pyruvoyltetrahydropterin/6-carboxytetrahydropterin synthase